MRGWCGPPCPALGPEPGREGPRVPAPFPGARRPRHSLAVGGRGPVVEGWHAGLVRGLRSAVPLGGQELPERGHGERAARLSAGGGKSHPPVRGTLGGTDLPAPAGGGPGEAAERATSSGQCPRCSPAAAPRQRSPCCPPPETPHAASHSGLASHSGGPGCVPDTGRALDAGPRAGTAARQQLTALDADRRQTPGGTPRGTPGGTPRGTPRGTPGGTPCRTESNGCSCASGGTPRKRGDGVNLTHMRRHEATHTGHVSCDSICTKCPQQAAPRGPEAEGWFLGVREGPPQGARRCSGTSPGVAAGHGESAQSFIVK